MIVPITQKRSRPLTWTGTPTTVLSTTSNLRKRSWDKLNEARATFVRLDVTLTSLARTGREVPGSAIARAMLGNVVGLEGLRQSCPEPLRTQVAGLQARYAESLSWLSEEDGDAAEAAYWTDRCAIAVPATPALAGGLRCEVDDRPEGTRPLAASSAWRARCSSSRVVLPCRTTTIAPSMTT
jgi:hypothetical protein